METIRGRNWPAVHFLIHVSDAGRFSLILTPIQLNNYFMQRIVVCALLTFSTVCAFSQDRGIGLRLGIPSGLTYKKYLPRDKAAEFIIGSVAPGWHHYYYENSFSDFDKFEGYRYHSHRVNSSLFVQGRYLLRSDIHIEDMEGNLEWYWGVGGLVKFASVTYYYRDRNNPDDAVPTLRKTYTDVDLGPEGIIGMEYTFEDVPLTVFGEFSLFIEFANRPGTLRGLSGTGIRYNF
jgi:hypothetical protein